jgi:hypothetical protein
MKKILLFTLFTLLIGNVYAYTIEFGIDEVLLVDDSIVTFDVAQNDPSLVLLSVETPNETFSRPLAFGETLGIDGVNYTIGRLDIEKLLLTLHIFGNYSKIEVLKKRDFSVEVLESFNAYLKVRIKNTGYFDLNDTLKITAGNILLKETPLRLKNGEEYTIILKNPPSNILTFSLIRSKISKTIFIETLEELVTIEKIWKDEKINVLLKNHGKESVNITLKLLFNGLTIETRRMTLQGKEIREVEFESDINQGTILLDYGVITQESFYFEPPEVSLVKAEKEGNKVKLWLENEGKTPFSGKISIMQNSVIIGDPYYHYVKIEPNEKVVVEFKVPEDALYLSVLVSSKEFSATIPIALEQKLEVKAVNTYAKTYLGGSASYIINIKGNEKVELGIEGIPESIKVSFYYKDVQINELQVLGETQVLLLLTLPTFPQGFRINDVLDFNLTIGGIKLPLRLEIRGGGVLPVYGDNWLLKMNYTSEIHHIGVPYRVVGSDITPPYIFESDNRTLIAFLYGRYVRQGKDLTLHILNSYGKILVSSQQPKGQSDYVIFNASDYMIMVEGRGYFNSILLVADYLNYPKNLSFSLKKKEFGEGLKVFIINATYLRGKALGIKLEADKEVELRAYYFTPNSEKEEFDPLSTDLKKALFALKGKDVNGEINVRSDEDFLAIAVKGEGDVKLSFEVKEGVLIVEELRTKKLYLAVLGLLGILVLIIVLERRIG